MPKGVTFTIETSDGQNWPCRLTLGAMRRYKQITGEDVSQMAGVSDMGVLVWCCCKSACAAENRPMDVSLDDFLDRLEPESLEAITSHMNGEKKTTSQVTK